METQPEVKGNIIEADHAFFTLTSGCIGRQKKERKKTKREVGRCCDSWAIEEGSNAITSGKKFLTTFCFNV